MSLYTFYTLHIIIMCIWTATSFYNYEFLLILFIIYIVRFIILGKYIIIVSSKKEVDHKNKTFRKQSIYKQRVMFSLMF